MKQFFNNKKRDNRMAEENTVALKNAGGTGATAVIRCGRIFLFGLLCLAVIFTATVCGGADTHSHSWKVTFDKYSTVGSKGSASAVCRTCGKKQTVELDKITPTTSVKARHTSTLNHQTLTFSKRTGIFCQGIEVVKIVMPQDGELLIRCTDRKNIRTITLHKASTFKDSGTLITTKLKRIKLSKGTYYLRVVRTSKASSSGSSYYFSAAGTKLSMRFRTAGAISSPNVTKTASSSALTFSLSVTRKGGAALTYSSDNPSVTVAADGKVTVAAGFVGTASIKIHAEETALYTEADKTITLTVKLPKTSVTALRTMTGQRMKISWSKKSGVSGYQVQYSRNSTFSSGCTTKTIDGKDSTNCIISSLLEGKVYYIRVRTYLKYGSKKVYSEWSDSVSRTALVRILMIGNSLTYFNSLSELLGDYVGAEVTVSAESGVSLADHLDASSDLGQKTLSLIKSTKWDYVIIQDFSRRSYSDNAGFAKDVAELCSLAKKYGAQPILYETWAYQKDSDLMNSFSYSYDEMYKRIAEAYTTAAEANGAYLAEVGKAFYEAGGGQDLYVPDHKHPSVRGSSIAAKTIGKVITDHES